MIICPVNKCVWGPINNLDDLKKYVAKSGQFFGQDLSGPASNYNPSYPSDQTLYQYMGWGLHQGLDIPCSAGTEVYASHDGVVWKTSETISQGLGIVIESTDEEWQTVYWHHKKNLVKVGDKVKQGDLIALSDNTGFSAGNHLHWEVKKWDGGQYVAIDPIPLLEDMKKLTKEQVIKLQILEGYQDLQGAEYWSGKELDEYLKARFKDKISELQKYDS